MPTEVQFLSYSTLALVFLFGFLLGIIWLLRQKRDKYICYQITIHVKPDASSPIVNVTTAIKTYKAKSKEEAIGKFIKEFYDNSVTTSVKTPIQCLKFDELWN